MEILISALMIISMNIAPKATLALAKPPVGGGISARLNDQSALVQGRQHLPDNNHRRAALATQPKILTSYQRVCSASAKDDFAAADVCHRSSTLCSLTRTTGTTRTTSTASWIMKARATPAPGPNDWDNTGIITCRSTTDTKAEPVVTAADFRRLPIPPSRINIQPDPAKSPTLINIPTNLYVDGKPRTLPTTVLGQPVRVRATPTSYAWRYGDGTGSTTGNPGGPYPDLTAGHTYTRPGTYAIALATTFAGQYSVAGGPWQPIAGTAAVTSPTVRITALEARNQLTR